MSDSNEIKENLENPTVADSPEEKETNSGRRQFFTGIATAIGAGLVLHGTQQISEAENNATQVRSRIVSRIQEELKKSQNEALFGYDKPDNQTPHGRYVKADPEEIEPIETQN